METLVGASRDIGCLEALRDFLNFLKNDILMEMEKQGAHGAKSQSLPAATSSSDADYTPIPHCKQ